MTILVNLLVLAIILTPAFLIYRKERKARLKAEEMLTVVRQMGELDDRIHRMRLDDPEDWPGSREAQMLIAHRVNLHERYSGFLGHHPIRDTAYVSELMSSAISK